MGAFAGWYFLGEQMGKIRILGAVVIFAGNRHDRYFRLNQVDKQLPASLQYGWRVYVLNCQSNIMSRYASL